jgi:phosphatidylglycerophosphatase A
MEILGLFLVELVFSFLCSIIGWVCLHVWYRNRTKVKQILKKDYSGEFSTAGGVMMLNLVAGVGAIAMFSAVLFLLGFVIFKWIAM